MGPKYKLEDGTFICAEIIKYFFENDTPRDLEDNRPLQASVTARIFLVGDFVDEENKLKKNKKVLADRLFSADKILIANYSKVDASDNRGGMVTVIQLRKANEPTFCVKYTH